MISTPEDYLFSALTALKELREDFEKQLDKKDDEIKDLKEEIDVLKDEIDTLHSKIEDSENELI